MNLLSALMTVRSASRASNSMRTRQGRAAAKVVDYKIQGLLRKKAWRNSEGATPVHMGVAREDFAYPTEDDPVTAALRRLVKAEEASIEKFTPTEITELEAALKQARDVLEEITLPLV